MLYLYISLSRSKLCHALCHSWACACVVTSTPSRVCLDVTTCEINPCGVGVLDSCLSSLRAMLICLPCLLCTTRLAFFTSLLLLHTCQHVHAWVYVSSVIQSNGTRVTRSKPTFVLLGHPLLFDNMLICLLCMLHMSVCPCLASFASLSFSMLSFYLFLCLSASLFPCLLYVHVRSEDAWNKGATS